MSEVSRREAMTDQCKYFKPPDPFRCPELASTEQGLCIFHDPSQNKDAKFFRARFEARLSDEKEDALRFDISFEGVHFRSLLNLFQGARFHGKTSFEGARFDGSRTSFEDASSSPSATASDVDSLTMRPQGVCLTLHSAFLLAQCR